jgi:rare lipoprotein A
MKKKFLSLLAALGIISPARPAPHDLVGIASFYGREYVGRTMANGQPYNPRAFTLACYSLPLGTVVYITYRSPSGWVRHAHATVTDRGPNVPGRMFDLSYSLFCFLENPRKGLITISAQVMP